MIPYASFQIMAGVEDRCVWEVVEVGWRVLIDGLYRIALVTDREEKRESNRDSRQLMIVDDDDQST